MRFLALPGVFTPHSDSWMLAELIAQEPLGPGSRVLDLCTGSGILAIAAAKHPGVEAVGVDISRRAVLATRLHARLNGVRVDARRGDLFTAVAGERFDLIVSNPPYVPGEDTAPRGLARAWEGGPDGRRVVDRICAQAPVHLKPGGALMLVHSGVCGEAATLRALSEQGLNPSVTLRHTGAPGRLMRQRRLIEGQEEMVFVRAAA